MKYKIFWKDTSANTLHELILDEEEVARSVIAQINRSMVLKIIKIEGL